MHIERKKRQTTWFLYLVGNAVNRGALTIFWRTCVSGGRSTLQRKANAARVTLAWSWTMDVIRVADLPVDTSCLVFSCQSAFAPFLDSDDPSALKIAKLWVLINWPFTTFRDQRETDPSTARHMAHFAARMWDLPNKKDKDSTRLLTKLHHLFIKFVELPSATKLFTSISVKLFQS